MNTCERGGKDAGLGRGRSQTVIDPTTASANSTGSSGFGRPLQDFLKWAVRVRPLYPTSTGHWLWTKPGKGCDLRQETIQSRSKDATDIPPCSWDKDFFHLHHTLRQENHGHLGAGPRWRTSKPKQSQSEMAKSWAVRDAGWRASRPKKTAAKEKKKKKK